MREYYAVNGKEGSEKDPEELNVSDQNVERISLVEQDMEDSSIS